VLYSKAKPMTSSVVCPTGDITQDVNWFLKQSDQTAGHVHIESQWQASSPDGKEAAKASFVGGVFVQLLAQGDESVLQRIVESLKSGDVSLWQLQQDEMPLPEVAAALLPELGLVTADNGRHFFSAAGAVHPQRAPPTSAPLAAAVIDAQEDILLESGSSALGPGGSVPAQQIPVDFFCRCTKDGFLSQVQRLPESEICSMRAESPAPILTCLFCNADYELGGVELDAVLAAKVLPPAPPSVSDLSSLPETSANVANAAEDR
jgi:redox-regulated HSP33 family molecular chaperone